MTAGTQGAQLEEELLLAVQRLRQAEADLNDRRRDVTGRGQTDSRALDLISQAQRDGVPLTPKQLTLQLRISTASTTILLDRLAQAGLVERRPHPTDRRSLTVHLIDGAQDRDVVDPLQDAVPRAAGDLDRTEAEAVIVFLRRLSEQLETVYR